MTTPIDLHPAADRMATLVRNVRDDQLGAPTPCADYAVGDLLDHISGFPLAFRAAAVKQPLDGGPSGDASQLADDWRTRVPSDLATLAAAWDDPGAWEGVTAAGGVDLPGEVAGCVALDELVLHGWDLAVATGQDAAYDGPGLDAVYAMVQQFRGAGIEGLFGPEVPVPDDAPLLDRILGLAGRDPELEDLMTLPRIATREAWLQERIDLLAQEKELTRRRDALNAARRNLPMVEITKDYVFDGPDGEVGLLDLFDGRRQLIVYHFMFDPSWEDGCPSCTAGTDELSPGFFEHLHTRDTSYTLVSRAPLAKLERWKARKSWDIPWVSSFGTDFNYDFGVTIDESNGVDSYNFRSKAEFEAMGDDFFDFDQPFEMPGRSCFLRVDDRIFHTYSQYARGLESTGGSYYFLDLTALGRQEDWEEPKGRTDSARSNRPDFAS